MMTRTIFLVFALAGLFLATGCGAGSQDKPASISTDQQVKDMVKAREIFDASDKNYDHLAADKKSEYDKLVGGPDKARRWWDTMSSAGGSGQSSGPSSTGPR